MRILAALLFALAGVSGAAAQSEFTPVVSAILEPAQRIEIRTSVNGRIAALPFSEGQDVSAGDVLAGIDARVQQARVAFARVAAEGNGAVSRAQSALSQAQALQERVGSASAKGAAHAWEVTQAKHAVELAQADLDIARENQAQARQQLALEQATLEEFTIKAPFAATILEVFAELGETIDTQSVIMEVGDLDHLRATAFVPAEWAPKLKPGQDVPAEALSGEVREIVMRVVFVDPRIDPASQTVRVVLEVDNEARQVLVGSSVTLKGY